MGLLKFKPGNFTYMSSRNNNFSNRAQKAKLRVLDQQTAPEPPPVNLQAVPLPSTNPDRAAMRVTWAPPGSSSGHVDSDTGRVMWNMDQESSTPDAYYVMYTLDGGVTWYRAENCGTSSVTVCDVDYLPAGTPVGFKVHSYSEAGLGAPSDVVLAATPDSEKSEQCRQELLDYMEGKYLSSGMIVLIVLLVMAGAVAIAFGVFMIRRRQPPPPPPPGMMKPPDYA